ncbi:MAG: hypothetical protein NZ767_05265 [SAR86 cluster bacterium]|nr:hypothetical protein [SAR86 cluster bacterium]
MARLININEGNFKSLTFEDYIDVLPRNNKTKPYRGGYITNCINPLHPDTDPSLHLHPGNDQVCIWKCFGQMGCSQETLSIEFNKLLIEHGKLKLEKLYTQTLEGFLQLGIISQEEFNNVCKDRKRKSVGLDPSTFNPLATTHGLLKIQTQRTSMEDFRKLRTKILGDTNDT